MVQIFVIVSAVGYFSYQSGKQAVIAISDDLRLETSRQISDYLKRYLNPAHQLAALTTNAIDRQEIDFNFDDYKPKYEFFYGK